MAARLPEWRGLGPLTRRPAARTGPRTCRRASSAPPWLPVSGTAPPPPRRRRRRSARGGPWRCCAGGQPVAQEVPEDDGDVAASVARGGRGASAGPDSERRLGQLGLDLLRLGLEVADVLAHPLRRQPQPD